MLITNVKHSWWFCLSVCHCARDTAFKLCACVLQQTALCGRNGRGQGSSIAASCHTLDLKRQCANST